MAQERSFRPDVKGKKHTGKDMVTQNLKCVSFFFSIFQLEKYHCEFSVKNVKMMAEFTVKCKNIEHTELYKIIRISFSSIPHFMLITFNNVYYIFPDFHQYIYTHIV